MTNEEIDFRCEMLISWLRDYGKTKDADILLALKARAETAEAALDGSPVVTKFFVDMLKQKCDAEKARADAAENNIEQQVVNAIKNRVALLEMQRDEALSRVGAAEYEAKRYCQDVARWHERAKIMEKALTKIASCKKHVDGDVVDIARKALEAKP